MVLEIAFEEGAIEAGEFTRQGSPIVSLDLEFATSGASLPRIPSLGNIRRIPAVEARRQG
jgi:hypothetical protein